MICENASWTKPKSSVGLKVFVPLVHAARAGGLAKTLLRAGHSIWMNAKDSAALTPYDVPISEQEARQVWGSNVFCYSGNQILFDPPDVIIVGYEELESSLFALHEQLCKVKPIVICCLSGNYQSHFDWTAYRGSICADEPSRALSRYCGVPALRYYELFEPDQFPFQAWQPSDTLVLPVLVKAIRQRFPFSAQFCDVCSLKLEEVFGDRVSLKIFDDASLTDAWAAIRSSPVVLAIKDQEGYGWAMLEALSIGRPIVYQAGLLRGMEFHKWTIPGTSSFSFETPNELVDIARDILAAPSSWQNRQPQTAAEFRRLYDGAKTADDLNAFLENLVWLESLRWKPDPSSRSAPAVAYRPSLDPEKMQEWEILTDATSRILDAPFVPVCKLMPSAFISGWILSEECATSLGDSRLDLRQLPWQPGLHLCLRHHRAQPLPFTLRGEAGDIVVQTVLPVGVTRIPISQNLRNMTLDLVAETWCPRDELGSDDTRIFSFELVGLVIPGN